VGTFVTNPARTDWFFIGYGGNFTVPTGGATLYLAVNESYSPDNHGNYSITFAAVPEPSVVALLATGIVALGASRRRRVG